jgi:tryptophanyl-tRNA synthetase
MAVATKSSIADVEARYDGAGYGRFKEDVGEAVVELLVPIQERYNALRADPAELERLIAVGAAKAKETAAPTLAQMYERIGFVRSSRDA